MRRRIDRELINESVEVGHADPRWLSAPVRGARTRGGGVMGPARLRLPDPGRDCEHLHDTTSRYDHAAKRLELFLCCTVCRTAKLIHSLDYEPRFER